MSALRKAEGASYTGTSPQIWTSFYGYHGISGSLPRTPFGIEPFHNPAHILLSVCLALFTRTPRVYTCTCEAFPATTTLITYRPSIL